MNLKLLFKYTTRSRPDLFERGLLSIINNISNRNYHILVSVDIDDRSMDGMINVWRSTQNITFIAGNSLNKIDAINRDINNFSYAWDVLINMSDDMVFKVKGFDAYITQPFKNLETTEIKNLDKCLHFPDGNRNDLITLAVMGRTYYERFNYIYHPDYKSLWCDNEMTDVARELGCYEYIPVQIIEHLHPAYLKHGAVFDEQYSKTESYMAEDGITYQRRKANGWK